MKKVIYTLVTIGTTALACLGGLVIYRRKEKELRGTAQLVSKNEKIIQILDEFLSIKQEGKSLKSYFKEYDYKKIAIYGLGYLGKRLYDELKTIDVEVVFFIDKNIESQDDGIPVYTPDQDLPNADVVVITPVFYFHNIENELEAYVKCPIVSMEDVLDEVLLSQY